MGSKLLSAYIYLLFITLMIFAFLSALPVAGVVWLMGKDPRAGFQWVVQYYWQLFLFMSPLIGKITVVNPHNLNRLKPAVYVVSHQSSIDFVLIGSMIDNFATISNHPISDLPIFFKVPRLVGVFYMQRDNPNASILVYNRLQRAIKNGVSIFMFPEGTRNYSDRLKPFQKGAFRLALENNTPIVPVIIQGTGKIVTKDSNVTKTLNRTDIRVTYLDPITPQEGEKVRELVRRVHDTMQVEVTKGFS